MDEKYGSEWSGWCSRERHGPMEYVFGSASEVVVGVFLDSLVVKTNGGGVNICFWHDWWYREGVLKEIYMVVQTCTI